MEQIKFRDWLYENGMTISSFCRLAKISRNTLYRWMNGSVKPLPSHMVLIKKMSKGMFRSPQDLLE